MSTPLTMSGFNGIDFNIILNSLMAAEQTPITDLQTRQATLKTQSSAFSSLATKVSAVEDAAQSLQTASTFAGRNVTTTNSSIVTATTTSDGVPGVYDVVVSQLARSQVTASTATYDDVNATAVVKAGAEGGKIVIGGKTVSLAANQSLTLQGLADKINAASDIGVRATIVSPTSGKYQLVLTGTKTGVANAFTVSTSGLTTWDEGFTNKMEAADAQVLVNNVTVTSSTNVIDNAIPGTSLTLLRKSTDVVAVSVTQSSDSAQSALNKFVSAYNALGTFIQQQSTATDGLGHDPLLRSLQNELRDVLSANYSVGNTVSSLAVAGVGFARTGGLALESSRFTTVKSTQEADMMKLFLGSGDTPGVFKTLTDTLKKYTDAGALIANAQDRIASQVSAMTQRMADMQDRLATRRASLQQEMTAADLTISQLNSQSSSLTSMAAALAKA